MQHYVQGTGQLRKPPLHGRPHAAPDTIALHGASQHLTHGESHSRTCLVAALTVIHRNIPRKMFLALLVNSLKVCVLQQS